MCAFVVCEDAAADDSRTCMMDECRGLACMVF